MSTERMSPEHLRHVCDLLSYHPTSNIVGLCNHNACIMYDQWTPNSVCVHSWIPEPRYLTKGFLREMFRYPFEHVDWIIGVTPGDNAKALAFNKRIGFIEDYRLRDGFARGVDQVYQIMHYTRCKYWQRTQP